MAYRVDRLSMGLGLMYGAGLLSALLGIGSGVLKIPAMDTALRLPIKVSSATSNFMIGVTAAASAGGYFMRGAIVPEIAGPVALGFSCRRNSGSAAAGVRHAWQASPDLRRCSACPGSPDGARGGWRSRRALSMTILTSGAPDRLNNRLARLLVLGTWMSCGLIMIGMASPALGASPRFASADFVSTGIVLLIALPTMRVATMAVWFLFNDDRDFALIAFAVFAIIVASTLLGAGAA